MEWYIRVCHPFAENPKHATRVHDKDKNSLRNHRALDVTLQFRCTPMVDITIDDVFQMADQVIAFPSGAEHTYQSTIAFLSNQHEASLCHAIRLEMSMQVTLGDADTLSVSI
ncbi:hypothetical protein Syun_020734 [Stephania yunnanensis]|uniref:Uncharacterized protein n=1 Tax=Stephania yunnanensis TaxID=152371 RepID=A0AAP0IER8_9MAGN